jgi:hypothetical protein
LDESEAEKCEVRMEEKEMNLRENERKEERGRGGINRRICREG